MRLFDFSGELMDEIRMGRETEGEYKSVEVFKQFAVDSEGFTFSQAADYAARKWERIRRREKERSV